MNQIVKKITFAFLAFVSCGIAEAHDFTVTQKGQKLYFNIKSNATKTIEVTYNGSIADKRKLQISGTVEIPSKVKHNNIIYTVVGIGDKAFSGAEIDGIVIPATVKYIGDFAFEDCKSLATIVFPGGNINCGQGIFFKCTSIKSVTLGSDWTSVDLTMFRWSDSLQTISIPAKIKQIKNLKMLRNLQEISVDANNQNFKSVNGMLYNKNLTTLYGCPRAYKGMLAANEGTSVIAKGALTDCIGITIIDFPSTLQYVSFRETSRMVNLNTVIFRGKTPVFTAYKAGEGKFVVQTANPE